VLRPKTPTDLARTRGQIDWVEDDDLNELERKSPVGAAALGLLTWGGGRLYVGDTLRGGLGIAALIALTAVSTVLPAGVGEAIYWIVGTLFATWSLVGARAVNRFVSTAAELRLRQAPDLAGYRLLAAAAQANPALVTDLPAVRSPAPAAADPRHAELVARLRKLAALRQAGVLSDVEVRERKVDLLSAAAPATRTELEDLLFALLPLGDEGALTEEDFDFLKRLGGAG
jgi:hypothetical protein